MFQYVLCLARAIGDEKHMTFECTALASLRQQHADHFTPRTDQCHDTMRSISFFAQQDHLGVLSYVIDCLDFMNCSVSYVHEAPLTVMTVMMNI